MNCAAVRPLEPSATLANKLNVREFQVLSSNVESKEPRPLADADPYQIIASVPGAGPCSPRRSWAGSALTVIS
jgi:hypothetical protein